MNDVDQWIANATSICRQLDARLGEVVLRCIDAVRRQLAQDARDAQAGRLLPLGASIAAQRECVHRATIYRRAARHEIKSHKLRTCATNPAYDANPREPTTG